MQLLFGIFFDMFFTRIVLVCALPSFPLVYFLRCLFHFCILLSTYVMVLDLSYFLSRLLIESINKLNTIKN